MRLYPCSIRVRLALWYAGTLALILVTFGISIYFFVRSNLHALVDTQLDGDLALLAQTLYTPSAHTAELGSRGLLRLFRITENNSIHHTSAEWNQAGLDRALLYKRDGVSWVWKSPEDRCIQLKETQLAVGNDAYTFTVARDTEQIHHSLHRLAAVLFVGSPLAIIASLLGGYALASRALMPIRDLTAKARAIHAENISQRLTVRNPDDEVGKLAIVLNETFVRLDDSFEQLRRFTQDAAHELRTPLAIIRGVGEVGLQCQRDAEAYREVIASMLEEVDRLARLVDGLLTLTRADSSGLHLNRKVENIAALCTEVTDCLRVLADDKNQVLECRVDFPVQLAVDRDTLRLALFNIIANAIQFTPNRGEISVRVSLSPAGEPRIDVIDNGPGIAKENQAHLFERFYRADRSRSKATGGVGLGLAIATWAVELNGGHIEVESVLGQGACFSIIFQKSNMPVS